MSTCAHTHTHTHTHRRLFLLIVGTPHKCNGFYTVQTIFSITLHQGYSNLAREIHFPAEFSSNPNQTHLSMLIDVFRIIRKSQLGEFDQGWS